MKNVAKILLVLTIIGTLVSGMVGFCSEPTDPKAIEPIVVTQSEPTDPK